MAKKPNNPNAAANLRPFKKGDSRINRSGRPKSFDALRQEAIRLACEIVTTKSGDRKSVARLILEGWAASGDPQAQKLFIEYAYGKVPNKEELSGPDGNEIQIRATDYREAIAALAPLEIGSMDDSQASGKDQGSLHGPTVGQNGNGRGNHNGIGPKRS